MASGFPFTVANAWHFVGFRLCYVENVRSSEAHKLRKRLKQGVCGMLVDCSRLTSTGARRAISFSPLRTVRPNFCHIWDPATYFEFGRWIAIGGQLAQEY